MVQPVWCKVYGASSLVQGLALWYYLYGARSVVQDVAMVHVQALASSMVQTQGQGVYSSSACGIHNHNSKTG